MQCDKRFSVFLDGAGHDGSKPVSRTSTFSVALHLASDEFACVPVTPLNYRVKVLFLF